MGSVEEISRHRNRWRIWTIGPDGRRRSRRIVADGKRHAQQILGEWETVLATERAVPAGSVPTLTDAAATWVAAHRVEVTTRRSYELAVRRIAEHHVGALRLDEVTHSDVTALETDLLGRLSASSVRQTHWVLRGVFRAAVLDGLVVASPVVALKPPPLPQHEICPPTTGVVKAALEVAGRIPDPTVGLAVRLAAATGARCGELCGLQWGDVDGDRVTVRRSLIVLKGGGWRTKPTKTRTTRELHVDPVTAAALARHARWQAEYRAVELGTTDAVAWVLGDVFTGGPWLPRRLASAWAVVRAATPGAGTVRFHDLRHWHATQLLDADIPAPTLAARLGHAGPATTLAVYGHRTQRADRASADLIGGVLD